MDFKDEDDTQQNPVTSQTAPGKTAEEYEKILTDKSAAPEDGRTKVLTLLQALGGIAKDNGRASNFIGQQIQTIRDENKAKQKLQLDNYLKSRDMTFQDKDVAWEDKSRLRQEKEWGYKDEDRSEKKAKDSPDAPRALFAKQKVAKEFGVPVEDLQHLNYDETLEMYKLMKKDPHQASAIYQRFTSDDGSGTINQWKFNTTTGQASPIVGGESGAQLLAGLAPKLHSATGELVSANQGVNPSTMVKTASGQSLADRQTELERERAEARTTGTEISKTKTTAAAARASLDRVSASEKRWTELYAKAIKENDAGFIGGQWGAAKNRFGISGSPAGDQLRAELASETNKLRNELYGSALTDTEKQGLATELAEATQDPKLFAVRLKAWTDKYAKAVADADAKLSYMAPGSTKQTASSSGKPPPAAEVRRLDKATGKTAVFDAATKKFLRYED